MNRYIDNFKYFLSKQPHNYGFTDANSLLEMLCYYYAENNPVDNSIIRYQFDELDTVLSKLSFSDNNALFLMISTLCASYEKQAFMDGIAVGWQLYTELNHIC